MNAQDRKEYELALKIGKQRFGSPCPHNTIKNGHCVRCLRKVYQLGSKQALKMPDTKAF